MTQRAHADGVSADDVSADDVSADDVSADRASWEWAGDALTNWRVLHDMTHAILLRRQPRVRLLAVRFAIGFSAAVGAALLLTACASTAEPSLWLPASPKFAVSMGRDFTLAPGESVVANPGAVQLTFVGVTDDSRCPIDPAIQCIWGGSARVALRVASSTGSRDVAIETPPQRDTVTVGRFLVQLVSVTPAKLATGPIPASSYRATLRVTAK